MHTARVSFAPPLPCCLIGFLKIHCDSSLISRIQVPVDVRLDKFKEKAVPLVSDVARRAIKEAGIEVSDVSKLVVVSSTGFLGPGLDCELIKNLGLARSVDRTLIGFMGCAAAMNGFRNANDYVSANPGKYALMICVELSSVHTTFDDNINDAILHAIFADGCAAAVLKGAKKADCPKVCRARCLL